MARKLTWLLLAALVMTGGCGKNPQEPPAVAETTSSTTPPAPATTPTASMAPAPPKAAAASTSPPPLRELAARYLESDGHGGWRKNEQAATELEKLAGNDTSKLWPLLSDPQVEVRRGAAVFLLPQFDSNNRNQVAAFTALLDDGDGMVRARALDAARQFSRNDQIAALPILQSMLDASRENRAENRAAVARLCASLRSDAELLVPNLEIAATSDPDPKVRSACLAAAAQIASPQESVRFLKKCLADGDAAVRLVAAARLRQVGAAAAPAVEELTKTLADSDASVSEAAAEALIRVGPPAVEPLAAQLAGSSTSARKLALACLAKLGPLARPAATKIEKCRQDPDPQVRQLAEAALMRLAGK